MKTVINVAFLVFIILMTSFVGYRVVVNDSHSSSRLLPYAKLGAAELYCINGYTYTVNKTGDISPMWSLDGAPLGCGSISGL